MSIYIGRGFPCRKSDGCKFRVFPANADDGPLNEAAQLRVVHERGCTVRGRPAPPPTGDLTLDDLASNAATARADHAEQRTKANGTGVFHVTCCICADRFTASGPRATYCPKPECQAKRKIPVAA